ncbi:hypothetical protein B0H11DRAFT_412053 [Mycena galericulata]|nr:hypothetical protein B0H11DRAFT_412053 [Mycena galericulata]
MTRDESVYPEPERFNPARFFTTDGKLNEDNLGFAFGFGRCICVGIHAADTTVWATIVSVLSAFNIARAKDAEGLDINIDPVYSDGFIRYVKFGPRTRLLTSVKVIQNPSVVLSSLGLR